MDTGWTQDLLNWLTANPGWAGFWVFVMSFVESLAFVGILVPGIIILFGLGALISLGTMDVLPIWIWGSVGAFTGDIVSKYSPARPGSVVSSTRAEQVNRKSSRGHLRCGELPP